MFGALKACKRAAGSAIVVAIVVVSGQGCELGPDRDHEFVAEPIHGKVIDAETKQPLEGANVLAYWPTYTGGHDHYEGSIEIKETVTDANGEYVIEGWGPKKNPNSGWLRKRNAPIMLFFKPWYDPQNVFNGVEASLSEPEYVGPHLSAEMDGTTVELKALHRLEELSASFSGLHGMTRFLVRVNHCEWPMARRFLTAANATWRVLHENGIRTDFNPIAEIRGFSKSHPDCPSFDAVFGEIQ